MKNIENRNDSKLTNDDSNRINFLKDFEDSINNSKFNTFSAHDPNQIFRKLTNPRFMGSYHMKESILSKNKNVDNLFKGSLELKYAKSLRSIVFNPLTIALIVLAVLFNFFWFFYGLS